MDQQKINASKMMSELNDVLKTLLSMKYEGVELTEKQRGEIDGLLQDIEEHAKWSRMELFETIEIGE